MFAQDLTPDDACSSAVVCQGLERPENPWHGNFVSKAQHALSGCQVSFVRPKKCT